jgi:hypothetical protein
MSAINGDKARFHRKRKQGIHRRERYRKMFGSAAQQPGIASAPGGAKTQARQP